MSALHHTAAEAVAASLAAGGATMHAAHGHDNWAHLFERQTGVSRCLDDGDTVFERYEHGNTWSVSLECLVNARARIMTERYISAIVTVYHCGKKHRDSQ